MIPIERWPVGPPGAERKPQGVEVVATQQRTSNSPRVPQDVKRGISNLGPSGKRAGGGMMGGLLLIAGAIITMVGASLPWITISYGAGSYSAGDRFTSSITFNLLGGFWEIGIGGAVLVAIFFGVRVVMQGGKRSSGSYALLAAVVAGLSILVAMLFIGYIDLVTISSDLPAGSGTSFAAPTGLGLGPLVGVPGLAIWLIGAFMARQEA